MAEENLHSGHRERLRNRFMKDCTSALNDHELIELLLFYVLPRVNTNDVAHRLIDRFGSVRGVLSASVEELMEVKGIGRSAAGFLVFISDLCTEYAVSQRELLAPVTSGSYAGYFREYFRGAPDGLCLLMCTDEGAGFNARMSFELSSLSKGKADLNAAAKLLLLNRATRMVIGVNFADRMPVPTAEVFEAAALFSRSFSHLGIRLEDVILVSSTGSYSLWENGAFSF